ncbi:hypothetical protein N7451_012140 [Penicillium sp. IBT 35674x]|nr:hypothetical protein N7451_012140 [Penicillium sp. IBT 35674x]
MNPKQPEGARGNAPGEQGVTPAQQLYRPTAQVSFSEPPNALYEHYKPTQFSVKKRHGQKWSEHWCS